MLRGSGSATSPLAAPVLLPHGVPGSTKAGVDESGKFVLGVPAIGAPGAAAVAEGGAASGGAGGR
jgi:hypothetical protein